MTSLTPTYDWYANTYLGTLGEDEFSAALPDAASRVRTRCTHRDLSTITGATADAYMRAVCAAVDRISDPAMSSWSAGKVSGHNVDAASMTIDAAIERELAGTLLGEAWL